MSTMTMSSSIKEIAIAICAAQAEMPTAEKDGENPHFRSKFATLATVMKLALPILSKHKLSVMQFVTTMPEGGSGLATVILHTSGEYIGSTMPLLLVKNDPQAQGSAITYAKRYALMAAIGMVADEDDDAEKASNEQPNKLASGPANGQRSPSTERAACKNCGSEHTMVALTKADNPRNPNRPYWRCLDCPPAKNFSHWVSNAEREVLAPQGEINLDELPF